MQRPSQKGSVILAAGGVLFRQEGTIRKVLLVQRNRYGGDWVLPKGKLLEGEDFAEAALREVGEETGYSCRLKEFAGAISYTVDALPKVVLFWNMEIASKGRERDKEEVSHAEWFPVSEALDRLSYEEERSLLERVTKHE